MGYGSIGLTDFFFQLVQLKHILSLKLFLQDYKFITDVISPVQVQQLLNRNKTQVKSVTKDSMLLFFCSVSHALW